MFNSSLAARLKPCAFLCAVLAGSNAGAAADPLAAAPGSPLQTVVTVASRLPQAAQSQAADVVVITRADLEAIATDNLADVLQQRAGVQISRTGGSGQPASVLMRGSSASNTVVLVDGVRVGAATTGQFDFSTLPLAGIERIEVLRGPGSSLHGADAVGGVVLITTRAPGGTGVANGAAASQLSRLGLAAGTLGSSEALASSTWAGLDAAGRPWDARISASRQATQGVSAVRPGDAFGNHNPDADGFRRQALQFGGRWQPWAGQRVEAGLLRSDLMSRYDGAEYRPPTYAPDASPDFRSRTRTEAAHLRGDGELTATTTWQARMGRSVDDSTSGANELYHYRTRRDDASVQLAWEPDANQQWVLAWDGRQEKVQATGYAGATERDNEAYTLAYSGRMASLRLQAELRTDRNSIYGQHTTGRSGLRWTFSPQTQFRILAASTFRAPGFNELFFPGYGVTDLRPEEGRSLEAGVDHTHGAVRWQATVWRNRVENLIAYSADPAKCPASAAYAYGCAANIGQARLQGVTVEGQWIGLRFGREPARGEAALAPLSWGYDYTDARDGAGQVLPRRARHQWRLQTEQGVGDWRVGGSALWLSDRQESGRVLRGHGRLDLQARRALGPAGSGWSLRARVLNALNADFEPAADYRSPGRQLWLGLEWSGR